MKSSSNDKYKKIDPWKLVEDTLDPDTYLGLGVKILSWPFSFFKEGIPSFAKNDSKIKIMISLVSITKGYENLTERELKIGCNIFNSPWIANDDPRTINELRKKILSNEIEKNKEILKKYLDSLNNYQIYYLVQHLIKLIVDVEKIDFKENFKEFKRNKLKNKWIKDILKIHVNCYGEIKFNLNNPKYKDQNTNEYDKVYSNLSLYLSTIYSSLISTDSLSKEFDDLTKNIFEDKDTLYKAAVDSNYVSDKSTFGGPYHRLFDDSHSLGKMWGKIKDAKPDDSRIEEIIAWVNEAAKDLQTTMGLPVISMEKETFDKMAEFLGPIGISKSDLYDLLTYNLQEVLSAAILGITTMLPSIKKDKKKLNTLRGVMAASGVFGNPLAVIFLLITLVHSIIKNDMEQFKKDITSKDALVGFTISAIIKYTIDFLGAKAVVTVLAILLALVIVLYFVRNKKKKIDMKKFKIELVRELENLKEMSKNQLEKGNVKPLLKS